MVAGVRYIAQTGFEVNLTIRAETLAQLSGVTIHGNQMCIDVVGQQAALAVAPAGTLAPVIGDR